jgi:hypothetical protein
MAHASNFAIPARFNFRPYKASWGLSWAETVDWWKEPEPGPISIKAFGTLPPVKNSFLTPIGVPLVKSGDKVLVNVHIPSAKMKSANALELSGMLGLDGLYGLTQPYTVEINRADIPAEVLQPHENFQNTPDIAGREFVVLACPMPEFEQMFPSLNPEGPAKDAWGMQREFFEMEQDIIALRSFLNRWGLWNRQRGYHAGMIMGPPPLGFALVIPHLLWKQREEYKSAKAGKPRAWLGKASHLSFSTIDEPPYFLVERSYCQEAIEAMISIDHLSNVEFGICKRDDCRKLYERITRQQRLYCSQECAHLVNVRKLRAAKKKAESKQKGAKHNAKRKN